MSGTQQMTLDGDPAISDDDDGGRECAFCDRTATHVNRIVGYYVCDLHAIPVDVRPIQDGGATANA